LPQSIGERSGCSRGALNRIRSQRLSELLTASLASPPYRSILNGRSPDAIRPADLPVMSKPRLMASFNDWVCDPALELTALHCIGS
jgi:hypothetical protein